MTNKYHVVDMYENVRGVLICTTTNLMHAIGTAADYCIDTDNKCKLVIATEDGITIMFGDCYNDFTIALDLMRGLYRAGIIEQEDNKNG